MIGNESVAGFFLVNKGGNYFEMTRSKNMVDGWVVFFFFSPAVVSCGVIPVDVAWGKLYVSEGLGKELNTRVGGRSIQISQQDQGCVPRNGIGEMHHQFCAFTPCQPALVVKVCV